MGGHGATDEGDLQATLEKIKSLDKGNMSQYHKDLLKWTRNVDKGYAWVVLFSLWLMMCATLGPYRIYGLIYAKVTNDGVYTRAEASWPVAMIFTVENIVGPFVSLIAYHISYSQSMLIGSVLLTLGNGLTALSTSLIMDVILIGFVQGIGSAFIFMPFMELINNYFLRFRTLALGVALCGGTLAIFVWSPLFQWLLATYPWRYAYYGTGLLCALNLPMLPFLKPNPKPSMPSKSSAATDARSTLSRMSARALSYQNSVRRQSTILISRQIINSTGGGSGLSRQASIVSVNPFASSAGLERKISRAISMRRQQQQQPQPPVLSQLATSKSTTGVVIATTTEPQQPQQQLESVSLSELAKDPESVDMSMILDVLKTPAFHMIWYNELVYFWVFSIYCLVMVDYGMDRGCTKAQADSLLSYQSTGEIIGRLLLTTLVDLHYLSNKNVVILTFFLMSACLSLTTLTSGFAWMAGMTVAISALSSLLYILLNGLLVDYLGERKVTIGYGMSSFTSGVLLSFRPQALGFFRDTLGSYDLLMLSLGVACAIGGLLWVIEPLISHCLRRAKKSANGDVADNAA